MRMAWPRVAQAATWSSSSSICAVLAAASPAVRSQCRSTLAWRARLSLRSSAISRRISHQRQVAGRQLGQQFLRLRRMAGRAGEGFAKLRKRLSPARAGSSWRMRLRVKAVSALVGSSMNATPWPASHSRSGLAGDAQQGPPETHAVALETRRHGRQARQPGAAAQRQQHGFDLVVGMVPEQDRLQAQRRRGLRPVRRTAPCAPHPPGFRRRWCRASTRTTCSGTSKCVAHRLAMPLEIVGRACRPWWTWMAWMLAGPDLRRPPSAGPSSRRRR